MCWTSLPVAIAALGLSAPMDEPVEARNHRPVSLVYLRMPTTAEVLAQDQTSWDFAVFGANDFRRFTSVDEDSETWRLSVRYRQGWSERREWWIEGALIHRGPGFLDGIIDGWHSSILGWSDPVRDQTPIGRSIVRGPGYRFDGADGVGDLTIGASERLDARSTLHAAVKLPTGDRHALTGSGGMDFGVAWVWRLPISKQVHLQTQLGLIAQSDGLPGTRALIDQGQIALVWRPNSKDAWIAQWQSERAPISTGEPGADATHRQLTFGYRRALSAHEWLELSFSEDRDVFRGRIPEFANVAPDFGIGIRYIWQPDK